MQDHRSVGKAASWPLLDTDSAAASWLTNVDTATLFALHHTAPDPKVTTTGTKEQEQDSALGNAMDAHAASIITIDAHEDLSHPHALKTMLATGQMMDVDISELIGESLQTESNVDTIGHQAAEGSHDLDSQYVASQHNPIEPDGGQLCNTLWQRRFNSKIKALSQHNNQVSGRDAFDVLSSDQIGTADGGIPRADSDVLTYSMRQEHGNLSVSNPGLGIFTNKASQGCGLDEWLLDPDIMIPGSQAMKHQQQPPPWIRQARGHEEMSMFLPESIESTSPTNSLGLSIDTSSSSSSDVSSRSIREQQRRASLQEMKEAQPLQPVKLRRIMRDASRTINPAHASMPPNSFYPDPRQLQQRSAENNASSDSAARRKAAAASAAAATAAAAAAATAREQSENRYPCPHPSCYKDFSTSGHARRHSRIHTDQRPFVCPHDGCSTTFNRRDNCVHHQRRVHRNSLRLSPETE